MDDTPEPQPHAKVAFESNNRTSKSPKRSAEDEATMVGEGSERQSPPRPTINTQSHLRIPTEYSPSIGRYDSLRSPSATREAAFRLEDDLTLLQAERQVSRADDKERELSRHRSRSRREEPLDDFDVNTNPTHEKVSVYKPPQNPNTGVGKFFKKVHNSIWLVRYFVYIIPFSAILLIPLLLGALRFKNASVGGVTLLWFSIWLEIVWLSLWAGRILAKCLPWPVGIITSIFSNNSKKWRDMMKQLELAATLFFWALAIEISFLPTMTSHHIDGNKATKHWETVMNKVLISLLVGLALNFGEKIIIQLIAISFHLRTYADRIDINKFQIGSLVKLYEFSKKKIGLEDQEFEEKSGPASGAMTPKRVLAGAQKNTAQAFNKFGDVAGKIAGDFTGKSVALSSHPQQVILSLLATTEGSQVIARRLYRTFCREETETVYSDDLRPAFENDDEAEAAFTMFDKDMNGDISMEELEAVCVEIGRERKSITASLKDLDSVVSKLDDVFIFIVCVITLLVFISLISTSAAGVLTSAGSAVLALSWLFSATAQEFLQSIIFVFVKHPFDVGDRVSIYGNTGTTLKGDDYFVKEISLLYTEFKKMEGHIVQAPNSYLNTLFILNQRRSGGLAEAVPVTVKFGTTLDQIDGLRQRLLEFVTSEKREYQSNILTELREITEAHAITLNVVFFYKSNWQNELLRLQRRNKFICAMMVSMQELGIEGPRMRYPGQKESFPVYLQNVPHQTSDLNNNGRDTQGHENDPPFVEPEFDPSDPRPVRNRATSINNRSSIIRTRPRGESLAQMGRRVDFSLGMRDVVSSNLSGDVFSPDDRERSRTMAARLPSPSIAGAGSTGRTSSSADRYNARTSSSVDMDRSGSVLSHRNHAAALGSKLTRVGTDSSLSRERSNHRNRFFNRYRNPNEDEADVEEGMAGIPEVSRANSRLDPRSGRVSPTAWRTSAEEPRGGPIAPSRSHTTQLG
jgi:small-conductance mechanosensitive channel